MHNGSSQGPREDYLPNTVLEDHGRTPLHEAASAGDEKTLDFLLTSGADRNHKDHQHGNTPLHEAAWKGYSRCVKMLCALPKPKTPSTKIGKESKQIKNVVHDTKGALHSALLSTRNFGGFSALHLAAQNGHNQSCREILLAGADPNVQNNYGDTALHTACRYGHAGATRILLSAKCDSSRINLNGDTPLHISCAMGRRKLTRILMEAGSRLDIKNAQDETPRDISIRKNLKEILEILDTPVTEVRHERDRSSSSSRQQNKKEKSKRSVERDIVDGATANKIKSGKVTPKEKGKNNQKYDVDPKHWSPYGCHYFPDPRNFPSPKLETLPKEPLVKGEQYYLDLAGNIRKGPVGVGNTCYCAPFFKHLEQKMNKNRKSIRKYVDKATEKIDHKVQALAIKTDDQIGELTRSMIADRVQCENKRLHLEQWLKRGIISRATVAPHTSKSRKDQVNANTLTRCRSLELLDDEDEPHMKTSTPHYSRSVELLDSQNDIIIHRDADYSDNVHSSLTSNQKNHPESEKEKMSSFFNSDKEHNSEKDRSSKLSSQGYSDNRERLTPLSKDRNSVSDKDAKRKRNWYTNGEHHSEQSSSLKDRLSGKESSEFYESNSIEKIRVTERLEELLIKTKKILELEQITPKKRSKLNKYNLAMEKFKKLEKSNANLKLSNINRSNEFLEVLRSTDHRIDKKYDIAEEMNKITKSLLANDVDERPTNTIPVSPEIAKENTPRKEQPYGSNFTDMLALEYQNTVDAGSNSRTNAQSTEATPIGVLKTLENLQLDQGSNLATRNADEGQHDEHDDEEDDQDDDDDDDDDEIEDDVNTINGFYTNDCFDDPPSSSNNTLKSQKSNRRRMHQTIEEAPTELELESNDQCDLSMKNIDELNELKSRILNGTNWRSQVLKNSKHKMNHMPTGDEYHAQDSFKFNSEQNNSEYQKYEIKNSEIKILKHGDNIPNHTNTINRMMSPNTNEDVNGMGASSKVKELIAKLQGCQLFEESLRVISDDHPNDTYDSESSEDDDVDDDEDEEEDELNYVETNHQQQTNHYSNYNPVNHNNNYLLEYKRAQPQLPLTGHTIPDECNKVTDSRCFIPKDAYFHEIPNKNRLRPITDNLPEQRITQVVTAAARNRNPLTINLNEEEVFNVDTFHIDNMTHPQPHMNHMTYLQQQDLPQQNGNIITLPPKEKLLTNRKIGGNFVDSNFIDSELININHQSQLQQQIQMHHQYQYQQPNLQYNSNYLATIQNERDAHNDSGYSTKICDSSHGPSPSLSGHLDLNHNINSNHVTQQPQYHNHHHHLLQQQQQNSIHLHHQPINHNLQTHHQNSNLNNNTNENYTDYFLSNLGASSLV